MRMGVSRQGYSSSIKFNGHLYCVRVGLYLQRKKLIQIIQIALLVWIPNRTPHPTDRRRFDYERDTPLQDFSRRK